VPPARRSLRCERLELARPGIRRSLVGQNHVMASEPETADERIRGELIDLANYDADAIIRVCKAVQLAGRSDRWVQAVVMPSFSPEFVVSAAADQTTTAVEIATAQCSLWEAHLRQTEPHQPYWSTREAPKPWRLSASFVIPSSDTTLWRAVSDLTPTERSGWGADGVTMVLRWQDGQSSGEMTVWLQGDLDATVVAVMAELGRLVDSLDDERWSEYLNVLLSRS
jgi:hypothetical protein